MSQIEFIIEKLNYDINQLENGSDINKDKNIKDINNAIEKIKNLGITNDGEKYINTVWYEYFMETVVTDTRALKLAKEISSDPNKAKVLIEKIFGPDMVSSFISKYNDNVDYAAAPSNEFISSSAVLMFYTLAKKIKSYMKSKNNRSLIYRGYIIHYMLDEMSSDEINNMTQLFKDLFDLYLANDKLTKILRNNTFYTVITASSDFVE